MTPRSPASVPWDLLLNPFAAVRVTACWLMHPSRYDSCFMYGRHIVYSPPVTWGPSSARWLAKYLVSQCSVPVIWSNRGSQEYSAWWHAQYHTKVMGQYSLIQVRYGRIERLEVFFTRSQQKYLPRGFHVIRDEYAGYDRPGETKASHKYLWWPNPMHLTEKTLSNLAVFGQLSEKHAPTRSPWRPPSNHPEIIPPCTKSPPHQPPPLHPPPSPRPSPTKPGQAHPFLASWSPYESVFLSFTALEAVSGLLWTLYKSLCRQRPCAYNTCSSSNTGTCSGELGRERSCVGMQPISRRKHSHTSRHSERRKEPAEAESVRYILLQSSNQAERRVQPTLKITTILARVYGTLPFIRIWIWIWTWIRIFLDW